MCGMTLSLSDSMSFPENVLFRELDGEAVLLNLDTGMYFGLDPVGTRIWQLIGQRSSLADVLAILQDEYAAERDVLEKDLLDLCGRLYTAGLCLPA
jgi:hypothetical protein